MKIILVKQSTKPGENLVIIILDTILIMLGCALLALQSVLKRPLGAEQLVFHQC